MKTAISLPDKTFEEGEKLAQQLRISRSELYAKALEEYIRKHGLEAEVEAFNRALDGLDEEPDPALQAAARRTFEANEW
ncbi:MAG: hypothetical protein IVW51_00240 [Thermaceae bacterium]|nr:hypothetical protein [Thermaceae bacterium]